MFYQNASGIAINGIPKMIWDKSFGIIGNEYALCLHSRPTTKPVIGDAKNLELCGNNCEFYIPDDSFCGSSTADFAMIECGGTITLAESGLMDVADWSDYASYPDNYFGGVAKVINYIRDQNPNIKVYLIGQANSGVLPLNKNFPYNIRNHMMELSMFLSVPFIDTFCHAGIDFRNWADYSSDGVHINEEGKKLVGRNAAYEMMYL